MEKVKKKIKVGDLYLQKWNDGEMALTKCTHITDEEIGGITIKILQKGSNPVLVVNQYGYHIISSSNVKAYKLKDENEALAYLI